MIERYLKILKTLAEDHDGASNAKVVAVLLHKGIPVSFGFNQYKSHPFAAKYSKHDEAIFFHAETDCIQKATKKLSESELKKCTLIVCRVKQDLKGNYLFGNAKPCSGCSKCIDRYNLKKVVYTIDSTKFEYGVISR